MRGGLPIPKSVAQLTGVLVTAIVAFGTDIEVYYAVPLGVFAGALAMFFVSLSEAQNDYRARWTPPPKEQAYRDRWERYK
jgi:hypothetical protein